METMLLLSKDTRRTERANVDEQWSRLPDDTFLQQGKRENMWNFNDSERNTVFGKCDGKMEMSSAKGFKNKTELRQHAWINLTFF